MAKIPLGQEKLKIIKQGIIREKNIASLGIRSYLSAIKNFEKKYNMGTKEFLDRYKSGELGDDKKWFEWLFHYKAYRHLKGKIRAIKAISV